MKVFDSMLFSQKCSSIIFMYHPITPKVLIKNSGSLKILFMILMVCLTCVIIQAIMFAINDCSSYTINYYTCYDNYYYRPNQCTGYNSRIYCCDSYYQTCGDIAHCGEKYLTSKINYYYNLCYGHYIAMMCLIGLSLILSIVVVVKIFMLRKQAKQEEQMRLLRLQNINPDMYQPPFIQPHYPVPQTYKQHAVNESTEE